MKYFIRKGDETRGPFELASLAEEGVRPDTYVWTKGMHDWERAKDVPEVCRMMRNRLYDIMHPVSAVPAIREECGDTSNRGCVTDRMSLRAGVDLPSLDEIEDKREISRPPAYLTGWAVLSMFMFLPTGIAAVVFSKKSRAIWSESKCMEGDKAEEMRKEAHEWARKAKMLMGISFFVGLIWLSSLIAMT